MRLRLKVTPMRRRRPGDFVGELHVVGATGGLMPVVVATGVLCEEEAALCE